ncbi:hypothetical protein PQG02_32250 (plasmid) [Nostoc sp. UHCC 0926]|uniref:hypothetical protein n=1 Tax=Nostoc sp. UHCC 0926 TaxID=3025190 RepID=UPI00235EA0BE|nr:hypothetical protein [Nostoc sp. UHCC 0926]WDD36074.1 hypothetical protein PQG02_32250 [Nostoc sp. UHCC 0926]
MPTAGCDARKLANASLRDAGRTLSVSHPDYRQTTIYINKQIEKRMKAAFLEDEVEDFSQWIEERIEEWLKGRKQG